MKNFILTILAAVAVVSASFTAAAQNDQPSLGDDLKNLGKAVLIKEGGRILDRMAKDGKAGKKARNADTPAPEAAGGDEVSDDESPAAKRTWADRRHDMVEAVIGSDRGIAGAFKGALDVVLDEYREQYKKEGREYAKELGDTLAERATNNPKIASTLTSVKILCWGVVVYLTLVTIYLVFTVCRLRRENDRLVCTVKEMLERAEKGA